MKLNSSNPKNRVILKQLYLNPAEFNLINEACMLRGIPFSTFLRILGLEEARKIIKEIKE